MSPDVPVFEFPFDMDAGEAEAEADVVVIVTLPEPRAESIVVLLDESIVKSVGSKSQFLAITVMSPILRVSPEVSTEPKGL